MVIMRTSNRNNHRRKVLANHGICRSPIMASEIARADVARATVAAALALAIVFLGCWLGAYLKIVESHMFIQLFTTKPLNSIAALAEGVCWSVVFSGLIGLLV